MTVYKDSGAELLAPAEARVIPEAGHNIYAYSHLIKQFAKTTIITPFKKLGVVFQPLGINHFLTSPLSELVNQPLTADFSYFENALSPMIEPLFSEISLTEKVEILDRFFLEQFIGFDDTRLQHALELLFKEEAELTVQDLSEELDISRRTLLRLFKKHLVCTPREYINLVRFRKAVDKYQESNEKPPFTALALDSDYYDQADFIRHFTRITGVNPKSFFGNLVQYGQESTFWSPDQ